MIRAKFRVLSVTYELSGRVVAKLKPVNPKTEHSPTGSLENLAFWEATPSGDAEFRYADEAAAVEAGMAKPGGYFYLNMTPFETGRWRLRRCKAMPECKQLDVWLDLDWDQTRPVVSAMVEMSILNGSVHTTFLAAGLKSDWLVEAHPAPGGHENCCYTGTG